VSTINGYHRSFIANGDNYYCYWMSL